MTVTEARNHLALADKVLASGDPNANAGDVLADHAAQETAGLALAAGGAPAPVEAGVLPIPPFVARIVCMALTLLRPLVKLNGQASEAVDTLIALVCAEG